MKKILIIEDDQIIANMFIETNSWWKVIWPRSRLMAKPG